MHELAALPLWVNDAAKKGTANHVEGRSVFTHYVRS